MTEQRVYTEKKWDDDWRDELKEFNSSCYRRFYECRNTKADIKRIAKLMYKYNKERGAERCLDRTIEWLCYWNNQDMLEPVTEEYKRIIEILKKARL